MIFGEYENTRPPPPPKSLISDSKYINSMKKHICETLCLLNNQHITDVRMMEILVTWDSKFHKKQYAKAIANKYTLTGWWIVRKQLDIMSTYHYVQNQGKLMMQSRENGKNLNLGNFLAISRSNICNYKFFWKIGFIQKEGHI